MIKEIAIDLVWLTLLFSALGLNLVIVISVGFIMKSISDKFKEGYNSKVSSEFTTKDNRNEKWIMKTFIVMSLLVIIKIWISAKIILYNIKCGERTIEKELTKRYPGKDWSNHTHKREI